MKKAVMSVFAAVCVAGGYPAMAQVSVPWSASFEGLAGTPLTNLNDNIVGAWHGDADVVAVITNIGSAENFSAYVPGLGNISYPIAYDHAATGTVVSFRDGGITNLVNGANGVVTYVDVLLQPVQMDPPTMNAAISNSQMSLYVGTNGLVNVYFTALPIDGSLTNRTPQWTVLDSLPPVSSGQWVRLTVAMDYTDAAGVGLSLFQVCVNGLPATNAAAFSSLFPFTRNGTWFVCANASSTNNPAAKISQVSFSGSGKFDDLVITEAAVQFVSGFTTIKSTAGAHGTITPLGTLSFSSTPAETNFVIQADPYYQIAYVSNGIVGAGAAVVAAQGQSTYSVPMSVNQNSYIDVSFAPIMVSGRTPQPWLAYYHNLNSSVSITDDTTDTDGDGAKEFQEYVAGTSPIDSNSVLKVLNEQITGATNTIQWLGTNAALGPYVVSSSANLTNWVTLGTVMKINGTLSYPAPATGSPMFYRVSITNY